MQFYIVRKQVKRSEYNLNEVGYKKRFNMEKTRRMEDTGHVFRVNNEEIRRIIIKKCMTKCEKMSSPMCAMDTEWLEQFRRGDWNNTSPTG